MFRNYRRPTAFEIFQGILLGSAAGFLYYSLANLFPGA